ncbi:MAG: DUF2939 domain-containing protein [Desulfobacteraceae bacterium]
MRSKTLALILAVLAFSGAIILGYLWFWQGTPRHALYQMVRAVQNQDIDNFFKFVDLQAIFNNFVNDASQELEFPKNNQKNEAPPDEFSRWSRKLGKRFARYLLPKLFNTFETQIKNQIERYLLSLSTNERIGLTALVTHAQIEQQGYQAEVTLRDPETNKPLRFRMQQNPETREWRVVEVNYEDFKELLKKEFIP